MPRAKNSSGKTKPAAAGPRVIALGKSCVIRDGAALKATLLEALEVAEPVEVDAGSLERVDASALQLLFAFDRDRRSAGRALTWRPGSEAFVQALAVLGLTLGADAVAPAGVAHGH